MPEVRRIARRVRHLFTHHVEMDDLIQAGMLGLVTAANRYDPRVGAFAPYAYWRIRGEMVDSQKRRAFKEATHASLDAIRDANAGWLPPKIDTDPAPLADAVIQHEQVHALFEEAVEGLPRQARRVMRRHLAGESLSTMARKLKRAPTWARGVLAEAREAVREYVVGAGRGA